jgi:23S rRNA (cytosine1962-C5)-methyltransferase
MPAVPRLPRLRLRVTATAEQILRGGHPWLFAESIREQNRPGKTGELVVVYDRSNCFLALGLYDPDSPLRVRVLHADKPVPLDTAWWRQRLKSALDRRHGLFDERTTGYRWINGESDGWPGVVLDRYGAVLVLKLYTSAWLPRLAELGRLIRETLQPDHLVLRLSRNIKQRPGNNFNWPTGNCCLPKTRIATGLLVSNPACPSLLRFCHWLPPSLKLACASRRT